MIMLKVTKNQDFTLSSEDTFLEKPQGGRGFKLTPSPTMRLAFLGLRHVKNPGNLGTFCFSHTQSYYKCYTQYLGHIHVY